MRTKTVGGRRRPPSATGPSLSTIPLLSTTHPQDEYNATVFETSSESDDHPQPVPMADCLDQHSGSDRSPLEASNHESIDLLDENICISCNKLGGGVLVCSERGCPVTLHANCICSEPKFDDWGNFYCPYCWYRRAVDKSQELREKAMMAKNALSSFLDKNVFTSDKLVQTDEAAKRKDGISLDGDNRQGTDTDRYEIALEGQADADGDFGPCREEEMPVHIKLVQDSMNWEKFDIPNISETHETRSLEGKESFETADSRHDMEDVRERIVEVGEDAEPLNASRLGKYTFGHSPDIAFAKGMQESVAKSAENKGGIKDKGTVPKRQQKVSATGSSVSETNDSDSEVTSVKKGRAKRKVQKTAYPQKVASVRKSLLQEHNTTGKIASDINEEVTSSKTLRQPRRSPKQV